MKGLRLGGSKYSDMDGELDLMPVMLADPSRDLKGKSEAKMSLSYNSMLMTRSGSVMTKEHVKELREHHGFCTSCPNEPVKLFEIKKSKINPLFRGKEAIDVLHESYNGVCLKCKPMMDPNKMLKRASLRSLNRDGSVRSLSSRGQSFRSISSRSRSSSPDPIYEEGEEDQQRPPIRQMRRGSKPKMIGTPGAMRRTPQAIPTSAPATPSAAAPQEDFFSEIARQNEELVKQNSLLSHQNDQLVRQNSMRIQPKALEESSEGSLGSHLQNSTPTVNNTAVDDFSMPDFSGGNTNFKTHRKKAKKKKKEKDKDDRRRNKSSNSKNSSNLHEITEENSKNKFDHSPTELFRGFPDADFGAVTPSSDDQSPVQMTPRNNNNTSATPGRSSRISATPSTPKLMNADKRLDNFPPVPSLSTPRAETTKSPFPSSFEGENSFFGQEPDRAMSFARKDSFPMFSEDRADNGTDLFSTSEGSLSDSGDTWGNADGQGFDGSKNMSSDSWPAPPSIMTKSSTVTTPSLSSEQTQRGSNLGPPSGAASFADDGSTFLDPPSDMSSSADVPVFVRPERVREASEQSLSLQDAILQISRSDDFSNSMSPSQLIQADEMLMSGIKADAALDATSSLLKPTSNEEVDEMAALLDDVAAAGNSEILIELLMGTIRENQRSVEIQELCLKHIWDHSKFNEAHKAQIMDSGLGEDVIKAMRMNGKVKKIQEYGCGCIWSLSVNQNNRILLGRAGAVKLLFRALEEFIEDEVTLETVFGALRTLSPEKEIREAIIPLLGARRVCRAMTLHRSSTTIQRDGCAFLSNIAVDMENQTVFVVSVKEIESVVRALGDHLRNESVVSSACFALKNYTYEEKNLRNLRRFGDVFSLLEDASKYSTKAEIRVDADEIRERLRLLCEEDDALEEIAHSSLLEAMENPQLKVDEAVANFIDVMKQYPWSEKLTCYSISSLLSLSRQSEEYLSRIAQFDVLKILVHVLYKSDSAAIQERGCETLKFLAEQGNRPRTMICDVDGSSVLIAALRQHYNNEKVKAVATGALEELSKDPRCGQLIQRELSVDHERQFGNSIPGLAASLSSIG